MRIVQRQAQRTGRPGQGGAQHRRLVCRRQAQPKAAGHAVAQPALVERIHERQAAVGIAGPAQCDAVTLTARPHRFRQRRVRHAEAGPGAIGLDDGDIKIAVVAGRIQIVDHETARSDGGAVDIAPLLADDDLSVAARSATNDRCIAALRIGQHALVRTQFQSLVGQSRQQLAGGIALAHRQFAGPVGQGAAGIGAHRIPAQSAAAVIAQAALLAQTPQAQVHAAVGKTVDRTAAGLGGMGVILADAVVEETHAVTGIVERGIDVAPRDMVALRLRQADVQPQA